MNRQNTLMRALLATLALLVGTQAFAARTTTYYHNDGLGSVVAATDQAGAVLWRKDYAPFGEQIDTTPETERVAYTGKLHDDDTGLSYFGARYYDPELGRFTSVDPVGFVENNTMSFNRYLYVNNNPYKYVDPDGEFLNFALKFVLDVGINMAINYVTTGELNVGGALRDSVIGLVNPAKTLASAGKLVKLLVKAEKTACKLSCFVAGTAILSEHGYVPIESLNEGDLVWAHNPETGETTLKPILRTFVNTKDSVWKLTLEKDGNRYLHEVTGSHPYYVVDGKGKGAWVEVANLQAGALLETEDGTQARLLSVLDTGEVLTTYNFEVADIHTYYVSAAKVLVHNCGAVAAMVAKSTAHANKVDARPATLYEKYDKNGKFLKHGVTKHENPAMRYTKGEIDGGTVVRTARGPRDQMLRRERDLVETKPGPDNREPWAGSRTGK